MKFLAVLFFTSILFQNAMANDNLAKQMCEENYQDIVQEIKSRHLDAIKTYAKDYIYLAFNLANLKLSDQEANNMSVSNETISQPNDLIKNSIYKADITVKKDNEIFVFTVNANLSRGFNTPDKSIIFNHSYVETIDSLGRLTGKFASCFALMKADNFGHIFSNISLTNKQTGKVLKNGETSSDASLTKKIAIK